MVTSEHDIDFGFATSLPTSTSLPPARVLGAGEYRTAEQAYKILKQAGLSGERAKVILQEAGIAPTPSMAELGVANFGAVDFNGELLENEQQVPIAKLQRMTRNDGHARALLNILTMPVRSAKWQVVPSDGGKREAKFVTDIFTRPPHKGGMSIPFQSVLGFLSLAIRDRFKVVEKIWESKVIDGQRRICLRKLAFRPTETLKIIVDSVGDFVGVHQKAYFRGRTIDVVLPKEKVLLYTYGKEEDILGGESAFNAAHYHYDKKHKLYYIAHVAYTVAAIPPRIGIIPNGTTNVQEITSFRNNMASLGLNTAMTHPEGWEVQALQLNRSFADFMPLINHHDFMMAVSVLAQFLRLGQASSEGSFALSANQTDLFVMAMQQFLDDIAATLTSYLLPDIVDYNFGTGNYPTFQFETLSDKATAIIRELFGKIITTSEPNATGEFILQCERRMAESLGLAVDYDAIEDEIDEIAKMEREAELAGLTRSKEDAENPPEIEDKTEEGIGTSVPDKEVENAGKN